MNTPAASPPPTDSVPGGHVQLNLIYEQGESPFYLQIPLDIITSLCLKPRKYLRFLGWCILGIKGDLAVENGGDLERISTEGDLEEEGIYYYRVPNNGDVTFKCMSDIIPMLIAENRFHSCSGP